MRMAAEEDQMQGPSGREEKIFVSVRLRPLNEKELARNDVSDWECINDTTIIYRSHLSISERSMYPSAYTFDRVFGAECSTGQVYEEGAKEVALSVVSGVNASVFAYGQTSSGKTYTMSGITDYTMADVYDYIKKHKEREFVLKFSAMEIYNESVRDLLSTDSTPLRLLDDPEKGTVVEKLTEATLRDWNHFKELLSVCEAQRQIGETALNEVSSRSHQILRLTIESTAREFLANDKLSALTATVNFIDLAGSERASQALLAGTRLKEGSHINRSLLTLGTVIRKLSKGKNGHIPFRDSKLTRILQPSLGGNARTAIICTMSPARIHVEQSRNTLLFASCAKEVTTNAQVNVVMSDKALVKHLQRELARLEGELRSPGRTFVASHVTELLKEKDLEIEKLKKEVFQLTEQLDLARSQIEDLQRMVGEEKLPEKEILSTEEEQSTESIQVVLDHQYPKLRVRSSWDSENVTPESPISVQPSNQDTGAESSNQSPRSIEHSYDENFFQLSDFKVDPQSTSAPQQLLVVTPETEEQPHGHGEETEEQHHDREEEFDEMDEEPDEKSEENCREVRCIEMERSSSRRYPESNTPECSPNRYEVVRAQPVCGADSNNLRPTKIKDEEEKVKEVSDTSLPSKEERESGKTPLHCVFSSPDKFFSEQFDKDIFNRRRNPTLPDFVSPSPEKPYPWLLGKNAQTFRGMRLARSRSCRASLISSSSLFWFEKDEKSGNTPPSWYEKEFVRTAESTLTTHALQYRDKDERSSPSDFSRSVPTAWFEKDFRGRPESLQTTPAGLHFGVNNGMLSPNESQACPSDASVFELETINAKASNSEDKTTEMGNEVTTIQKDKKIIHHPIAEIEKKSIILPKSFKDAALDPIQDYLATPLNWPLEFKRLQREIIELWHICNVSMAHRTYFFLLFRGDQKDCLYLEVELRRLSYIKESFTRGSKAVEDGRTLTPTSSMRALNRERYKLSQQMQKKLSKEERENLFLRWGIGLNTKHRRLQLAHRLWSETKDMEHVRESASVVGKLLGFVDMDLASKEMFGLNFTLRPRSKKSSRWKRSVLALSIL